MPKTTTLADAIQAIQQRHDEIEETQEPVECVAQGHLQAALACVRQAANMLGDDEGWTVEQKGQD